MIMLILITIIITNSNYYEKEQKVIKEVITEIKQANLQTNDSILSRFESFQKTVI